MATIVTAHLKPLFSKLICILYSDSIEQKNPSAEFIQKSNQYTLEDWNENFKEKSEILARWFEILSQKQKKSFLEKKINQREFLSAVLQKIYKPLSTSLSFGHICKKILGHQKANFVWVLPNELRHDLSQRGFHLIHWPSGVLWITHYFFSCAVGLVACFKGFVGLFYDFIFTRFFSNQGLKTPTVFFTGISESDISLDEDGLNIVSFIEEKKVPCFQNEELIYLATPSAQNQEIKKNRIVSGKKIFQYDGRKKIPLGLFLKAVLFQLQMTILFVIACIRYEWWVVLMGKEISAFSRVELWFEQTKPKFTVSPQIDGEEFFWNLLRKKFNCHSWTIFYSTNSLPLTYDKKVTFYKNPEYMYLYSDFFAVWNREQKKWLQIQGYKENQIFIAGPIIYAKYPSNEELKPKKNNFENRNIRIVVFDIAPFRPDFLLQLGVAGDHFTPEITKAMFRDIESAAKICFPESKITIALKPKRRGSPSHDPLYTQWLKESEEKKQIEIYSPKVKNPFLVLKDSNFVISSPFTSPSLLARHYQVPACFYDPSSKLSAMFLTDDHPPFIQGKDALIKWFKENLFTS